MPALRSRIILTAVALIGVLALVACSSGRPDKGRRGAEPTRPAAATITAPIDGASNVPTGAAIEYATPADGGHATVRLTDAAGRVVDGRPGYDPSTWTPARQLDNRTKYTATVTATTSDGRETTSTSTFTTMAEPSKTVRVQSWYADGAVVGVAAPLVLKLTGPGVTSRSERAEVQKRLTVTASPRQEGSWHWFSNNELHYRPKDHWTPGTKIALTERAGGLPAGNGYFIKNDLNIDVSVTATPLEIVINDKTHKLTAKVNGKVARIMPASLGKPSTPSSSGNMVIMTRSTQQIFDSSLGTGGTPVDAPGGYRLLVHWTMRLTWGGEFVHAAPWSVADQGHRDVSHGCTNVSTANARWLYEHSHIGDPVTVTGTSRPLKWGNGWTDWNVGWDDYLKGSAL